MHALPLSPYEPVSPYLLHQLWLLSEHWFSTQFSGLEHTDPDKPALYIGNHNIYGMDCPSLALGLYHHKHIWLRGLADRVHFKIPLWRTQLQKFGAFSGNRAALAQLMQAGEHILLYPGGSREVCKNKTERYQLIWKQRIGFAALAIEHGYDIIPFAAYGGDDMFDIVYDANDFNQSRVGKLAAKTGFAKKFLRNGELFAPITVGYKKLPFIPKPTPLHFRFMPRISTAHYQGASTEHNAWALRQQIERAIQHSLNELNTQGTVF